MIEKARALYPDLRFVQGNARTHNGRYDVLFSNVCLQWVPDHRALLPHLMRCNLNEGGVLAVQMPMNGEEPLFRIIRETADNPCWGVGDAANEVVAVLLDHATLTAADQTTGKQTLTVTLDNGLRLQLGVSGDTLCGCGGWSCPEFFEAFEAAL